MYKHFAAKERLFVEIVTSTVNEISDPVHEDVLNLADSGDIEADLRDLAYRLLAGVLQPRLMQLRRLVIGEASRFPELGRTFYERGPGRTIATLATAFERLATRDVLRLEDPELAANHFNWLIMSAPVNQAMLLGTDTPPTPADLKRIADSAGLAGEPVCAVAGVPRVCGGGVHPWRSGRLCARHGARPSMRADRRHGALPGGCKAAGERGPTVGLG